MHRKRFSLPRILLALVIAFILVFIWSAPYRVGQFYEHAGDYRGAIVRKDQLAARKAMLNLKYFVELNDNLKPLMLDGPANEYLFKEFSHWESAYDFLSGNFVKVTEDLKSDESYWGLYMRANAKWRLAQGVMRSALEEKDKKLATEKIKQAREMAYSTKEDYEEAIKKWQAPAPWLPASWNYDLTTDQAAMMRGLMPKPGIVRVDLGEGGRGPKKEGQGEDKGKGPGGEGGEELKVKGLEKQGTPKPGSHRPG